MNEEWQEYVFSSRFKIALPPNMGAVQAQGIDSDFWEWQGKNIVVRIDVSLFSDQLTSYTKQSHYTSFNEQIAGLAAKVVSFDQEDGAHIVAAHFGDIPPLGRDRQQKLTVFVESNQSLDKEIPLRIIRSIKFVEESDSLTQT